MSEVKLVLKDDVKNEIEYLKEKFEALLCCTQGNEPSIKSTRNLPDDCPIQLKKKSYALSDLIEINIDELEACIARIETELRLLEKIIKKRI